MDGPSSPELLLIACELAVAVECRPQRDDGTDAAVYASSGATLARRIAAGAKFQASCTETPSVQGTDAAAFQWTVEMQVGAARRTKYVVWLHQSPDQLAVLWRERKEARAFRESLPHDQRKKKPWGPL